MEAQHNPHPHHRLEGLHSSFCKAMKQQPQDLAKARHAVVQAGHLLRGEKLWFDQKRAHWTELHNTLTALEAAAAYPTATAGGAS